MVCIVDPVIDGKRLQVPVFGGKQQIGARPVNYVQHAPLILGQRRIPIRLRVRKARKPFEAFKV